jgi:hypothetical protein
MPNVLKLGAAALRSVPIPKPGVSADAYAGALHDWHKSHFASIYAAAGNLAIIAAQLAEAQDDESKKLLAYLESQSSSEKSPSDRMANGRTRADYNRAQRDLMRRRAAMKAAKVQS